jgi:hypothetical protein
MDAQLYHAAVRFAVGNSRSETRGKHYVVCGGRLYIRDQESLTAYDVRAR